MLPGSNPAERFDGPISLSVDEEGNARGQAESRLRMIHRESGTIRTIAGNYDSVVGMSNNPEEKDPLKLNLPEISSMDYFNGYLFVPTDLSPESSDLAILRRLGTGR